MPALAFIEWLFFFYVVGSGPVLAPFQGGLVISFFLGGEGIPSLPCFGGFFGVLGGLWVGRLGG